MRNRMIAFIIFLALILSYTYFKAIQLIPTRRTLAISLTLTFFILMLSGIFIYRSHARVFERFWSKILIWVGSIAMVFWSTFVLVSLPFDLLRIIVELGHSGLNTLGILQSHSQNLEIDFPYFYLSLFTLTICLVAFGFWEVLRGPKIKRVGTHYKNLAPDLVGLKIVQISDLHVGPTIRKSYVEKVVNKTNELEPDLIVLTGDIVDAHPASIAEHLAPLKNLRPRYGVFYVTGNHEYYWDVLGILSKLREVNVLPLINENRMISIAKSKILMAGVTDPMGAQVLPHHAPNPKKSFESTLASDFKIMLAHRPDACLEAEKLGFDLQFSGHTHAGQFFPFSLLISFFHQYHRGLYQHGKMQLYVNPGTGYWGPASRLGVPAEITLLTLNSK